MWHINRMTDEDVSGGSECNYHQIFHGSNSVILSKYWKMYERGIYRLSISLEVFCSQGKGLEEIEYTLFELIPGLSIRVYL